MFLTWLDLLPQMQAFEHRLFAKKRTVTRFVYRPPKVRPKNLTFGGRYFLWLNILLNLN